mmetsp:Transcript_15953/g.23510  ORF Transcript_15953/g.23510 Transcript_15953/m.23510 type:complete len:186 (-) Transcript_15953:58-615(-)
MRSEETRYLSDVSSSSSSLSFMQGGKVFDQTTTCSCYTEYHRCSRSDICSTNKSVNKLSNLDIYDRNSYNDDSRNPFEHRTITNREEFIFFALTFSSVAILAWFTRAQFRGFVEGYPQIEFDAHATSVSSNRTSRCRKNYNHDVEQQNILQSCDYWYGADAGPRRVESKLRRHQTEHSSKRINNM